MRRPHELYNTYSIVARDAATGQFGVAVQTHQVAVGKRIILTLPGYGALITQSFSNLNFVVQAEPMLRLGMKAPEILRSLIASDIGEARRQVGIVDMHGVAAAHTGALCIREASHHIGEGYTVQANMMTKSTVIESMKHAYESTTGDFAARLIAVMQAAQGEDGDIRGMQSSALRIVSGDKTSYERDTIYDVRVDEHALPLHELDRLVTIRRAKLVDELGDEALKRGDTDGAMALWQQARNMAPDQEELGFWQGYTLADHGHVQDGAKILWDAVGKDSRAAHWVDLIGRLQECQFPTRAETTTELLTALEALRAAN